MNADNHIYYDISFFNNDTKGSMPVNLTFSETRSGSALIEIPRDYFSLANKIINVNSKIKNYIVARFDDEVIHSLL